jgi:hypothetical protein
MITPQPWQDIAVCAVVCERLPCLMAAARHPMDNRITRRPAFARAVGQSRCVRDSYGVLRGQSRELQPDSAAELRVGSISQSAANQRLDCQSEVVSVEFPFVVEREARGHFARGPATGVGAAQPGNHIRPGAPGPECPGANQPYQSPIRVLEKPLTCLVQRWSVHVEIAGEFLYRERHHVERPAWKGRVHFASACRPTSHDRLPKRPHARAPRDVSWLSRVAPQHRGRSTPRQHRRGEGRAGPALRSIRAAHA